ncbi:uncharacterized protein N7496_000260 [Penicillium cataractarum]|uniref:Uncharacterized protein n=1 Tax=Penicillium cataractarum TaxID=2100454 RepID=A0A9W9VTP4_9EURO|nr:uncharacterized protein N7496_000260 [Penicillium cataractarum]KAJ5389192.1 hypothetical protein N7496_000260 [Penicillium cataractarum]
MSTVTTSTITEDTFDSLHTLWPKCQDGNLLTLASRESYHQADVTLQNFPGFQAYLYDIETRNPNPDPSKLATFAPSRTSQIQLLKSSSHLARHASTSVLLHEHRLQHPQGSGLLSGSTHGEKVIRQSLRQLLDSFNILLSDGTFGWRAEKYPFAPALFRHGVMEARVNDVLADRRSNEVFAILDTRTVYRSRDLRGLYWEETAKMVSWIQHDLWKNRQQPPPRYLIISQYQTEIFIIVGNFNKEYEEYIRVIDGHKIGAPKPVPEMMEMQEYGPFNIDDASHMKEFARQTVAYYYEIRRTARVEVRN